MKVKNNEGFIAVGDLRKKIQKKEDFTLLDVRTADEYKTGHIQGAISFNMSEDFLRDLGKSGLDKKKKSSVIVYCRNGSRSQIVFNVLKLLNFKDVLDMKEGLLEWKKNKLPLTK